MDKLGRSLFGFIESSLWDSLNLFVVGIVAFISIYFWLLIFKVADNSWINAGIVSKTFLFNIMIVISIYLLGFILDVLANFFMGRRLRKDSVTQIPKKVEQLVKKKFGDDFTKDVDIYRIVQRWVLCNGGAREFDIFLAKYGLCRALSFIFGINSFMSLCFALFIKSYFFVILGVFFILLFKVLFLRAREYYSYQAPILYNTFLIFNE